MSGPAVVVTGRGVVAPVGVGADTMFDALLAGRGGIVDGAGACSEFDPETEMDPRQARRADRFTQLAVGAAAQAAREAGLPDGIEPERLAVLVGTGVGGLESMQRETLAFAEGGDRAVSPHFVTMMMPNAAAGVIGMMLGAHGPGFSINSACATGSHAIGEAMRMIRRDEADVVVAGGTEAGLIGVCLAAFRRMGALSRSGESRPFDERRDGFVMGEGAGVLVLEREDHARARGAKVWGRIVGYGASQDAYHITQPDPEGRGAERAMRWALRDAGASAEDVGYVNAHGTSTPFNDRIESVAIRRVVGSPPVSSTKGAIGHLLGAAGAVEALVTLEAVRRGALPQTLGLEQPDPECEADHIAGAPREAPGVTLALSNSFGFGGQNACLAVAPA